MPHRSLRIAAAYHALGIADKERLINAADDALNDGVYSYNLGELATARDPLRADCTRMFESAVRELESPVPGPASAVLTLLEFHVVRLVEGVATPEEMLNELYTIARELRYESTVKVDPGALDPLQPFIDQRYIMEEVIGYRAYYAEQGIPQPQDDGLERVCGQVVSLAEEWCRRRWMPAVSPSWFTSTVVALVNGIVNDQAYDRLPFLADALQDAGCDDEYILDHLRDRGPRRRSFVVDLLQEKC